MSEAAREWCVLGSVGAGTTRTQGFGAAPNRRRRSLAIFVPRTPLVCLETVEMIAYSRDVECIVECIVAMLAFKSGFNFKNSSTLPSRNCLIITFK